MDAKTVVLEATGNRKVIGGTVFAPMTGYVGDCAVVDAELAARLTGKPANVNFRVAKQAPGDADTTTEPEPKRRGRAKKAD